MNLNGLVMINELWVFGLVIGIAIVIILAWISTKVHCDFRDVRTIILQANNQRVQNFENTTQRNLFQDEERLSVNLIRNRHSLPEISESISANENIIEESFNSSSPSISTNFKNTKMSFFQPHEARMRIKIKYLNDCEKLVFGDSKQTISLFKRNNFLEEQSQNLNIRLIYNGQELKEENKTLEQYGLINDCTIHCLVTQPRHFSIHSYQSSFSGINSDSRSDIELGSFMLPLFGAILIMIWYCRVYYRHYFNVITTFALMGLTIIYLIACITCFNFGSGSIYSTNYNQMHRSRSNHSSRTSSLETTRMSLPSTISSF